MIASEVFDDPNVAEDVARCCDAWAESSDRHFFPKRAAALRELATSIRHIAANKPPRALEATDLGMVEHEGELLLLANPAEDKHCFACTSRSACRDDGRCWLGWHNTARTRAFMSGERSRQ